MTMTPSTTANGSDLTVNTKSLPGETSIALAKVSAPEDFRLALEPSSYIDAYKFAQAVAKAGMFGVATAESALIRIMAGRSLGIPSVIAMQHVYDVEGRPSISAKLKISLCLRHPDCEYFEHVSSDQKTAIYKAKRRGGPEQVVKFEIADAERAGLLTRADGTRKEGGNWHKWPRRMLQARASSELADILFPDAVMGMPTREEAEDAREEMRGEVVETKAPPQAAPRRDFDAEARAIKVQITEAKTPEQRKAARTAVARYTADAGEPYASDLKDHYNAKLAADRAAAALPGANDPDSRENP